MIRHATDMAGSELEVHKGGVGAARRWSQMLDFGLEKVGGRASTLPRAFRSGAR